jgi:hypothetical protein
MSPESVSSSEAFLDAANWFSERLLAGLAKETSLFDFEKNPFVSYRGVLNPHRNVIVDCFRGDSALWTDLEFRNLYGLKNEGIFAGTVVVNNF